MMFCPRETRLLVTTKTRRCTRLQKSSLESAPEPLKDHCFQQPGYAVRASRNPASSSSFINQASPLPTDLFSPPASAFKPQQALHCHVRQGSSSGQWSTCAWLPLPAALLSCPHNHDKSTIYMQRWTSGHIFVFDLYLVCFFDS